jgi:hypothetical protein
MKFSPITSAFILSLGLMTGCGGGDSGPPADVYKTTCLPTKAGFNQLYSGMTYPEAVTVIGCEGSLKTSVTVSGVLIQDYEWGDYNAQKPGMVKLWVPFANGRIVNTSERRLSGAGLL